MLEERRKMGIAARTAKWRGRGGLSTKNSQQAINKSRRSYEISTAKIP